MFNFPGDKAVILCPIVDAFYFYPVALGKLWYAGTLKKI